MSTSARFVFSCLCWLLKKSHQAVSASDIIYSFDYFLGYLEHKWGVTSGRVFSPPLRGSPPPLCNHLWYW